jgi:integrase
MYIMRKIRGGYVLQDKLKQLIGKHASTRVNGRVASNRTVNARKECLKSSFKQLTELGYRLENPENLALKHVKALANYWIHEKKIMPKTFEGKLSNLRIFCGWIGKKGMIGSKYEFVQPEDSKLIKCKSAATSSKSWAGNDIDVQEIFARVDRHDTRLGLMLRIELAFGFRREEVLKCDPHSQDFGNFVAVFENHGKGGKARDIQTLTPAQREILDYVKQRIPRNQKLGWPYNKDGTVATLEQNIARYRNLMSRFGITKKILGVTGHGLRAQFSENQALALGLIPPSMGGSRGQVQKKDLKSRLTKISEALGHHRTVVMSAYFCSFGKNASLDRADRCMQNIDKATEHLPLAELEDVADIRLPDCQHIRNVLEILDVEIHLRQVQHLWQIYSARNGMPWMKPDREIGICIESAALTVIGDKKNDN